MPVKKIKLPDDDFRAKFFRLEKEKYAIMTPAEREQRRADLRNIILECKARLIAHDEGEKSR